MTAASEVAALRGIARRLTQTNVPIEVRQARAWGSAVSTSATALAHAIDALRAEVEGTAPTAAPEGPTGYEGVTADEAAARFASRACGLAVSGAPASDLMVERQRFVAAIGTILPVQQPAGAPSSDPGATGPGKVRRDARATSRAAALHVLPRTGNQRRRVLDAIVQVARNPAVVGLTDVQIAHSTGIKPNSVRPRRRELVEGGWLEPAETTREHHGEEHTVWVLTAKAMRSGDLWTPVGRA